MVTVDCVPAFYRYLQWEFVQSEDAINNFWTATLKKRTLQNSHVLVVNTLNGTNIIALYA